MGIPVGAKTSEHKSRGEGAAGQGGPVSLLILLITFLSGSGGEYQCE